MKTNGEEKGQAVRVFSMQKPTALVNWKEVMQNANLHQQCRHMLEGRVILKLCIHNYECKNCAYDQQIYEYDRLLAEEGLSARAA